MMFRYFSQLALYIILVLFFSAKIYALPLENADFIRVPYGKGNELVFNLQTRSYSVFAGKKKIISDAYSLVKNNGQTISSQEYGKAELVQATLTDGFGKGRKYTITLSKPGLPQMEQIFYVYPAQDFFFTEVSLKGSGLRSNYMAPLASGAANLYSAGDTRTLFVPFDNDTFIRYNAISMQDETENTSAEIGAFYDNTSRAGLIAGSVEHQVWKTGVLTKGKAAQLRQLTVWGGYSEEKITRDKAVHGYLSGNSIKSPKVFIGYFKDWRDGMEAYGRANRIAEKPYVFNWTKPTPFGWNSWGVIQEKLTYEKAVEVVDFFANELPAFRNDHTAYIDLDSFWDNFTGGMRGDYTKLKAFADYCRSKGLEPGVYWAPFTDWGWKSRRDREAEGSQYKFSDMWTKVNGAYHDFDGARALDPTHPGTKRRIDYIIDKLKACGFKMIKIDFLGHAAAESDAFYDKKITTGMQAYRNGMEYLVDRLDGQMLIYAAISPNLATGRYAHIRRIACDAWKTIKDTEYTLNSVSYGWWQTYVYNYIDADHVVFSTETAGSNKARLTSALITGTLITGDDYAAEGPWQETARKWLQDKDLLNLGRKGLAFMPLNGNTGDRASEVFLRKSGDYLYVAVINYGAVGKKYSISAKELGLSAKKYEVTELFDKKQIQLAVSLECALDGADAAIFKVKL